MDLFIHVCVNMAIPYVHTHPYDVPCNLIMKGLSLVYGDYGFLNNISIISWWSFLLVEDTGVLGENHRPVASH